MRKDGLTIGVVEDESSVCKALIRLITSAGFNVIAYGSTPAFLIGDYSEEPDLLVLDVQMPGMNGLGLQNHLVASGRAIPIVFITAHENAMAKATALSAGAVAFFQKPLDERALLGAIHKGPDLNYTKKEGLRWNSVNISGQKLN